MVGLEGNGFLSNNATNLLKDVARTCYRSDNFVKRHVISRLTYALLAMASLVTRTVDGIICMPIAAASILTCGTFPTLNNIAYRSLQAPNIINDLFYCIVKFINPWAGMK